MSWFLPSSPFCIRVASHLISNLLVQSAAVHTDKHELHLVLLSILSTLLNSIG